LFGLISVASTGPIQHPEASARSTTVDRFRDAKAPFGRQDRLSAYDDFKAQYLSLDPEQADSPEILQTLIDLNYFDWLNQLVEETFDEEPIGAAEPIDRELRAA
jgi:hypothetical protein